MFSVALSIVTKLSSFMHVVIYANACVHDNSMNLCIKLFTPQIMNDFVIHTQTGEDYCDLTENTYLILKNVF